MLHDNEDTLCVAPHCFFCEKLVCRCTVLQYYLSKCRMNIRLLDNINLFIKTSQMARVYGIQFVEVLTRGSQFRVESILLRLARKNGFVAPSMSALQRNLWVIITKMFLVFEFKRNLKNNHPNILFYESKFKKFIKLNLYEVAILKIIVFIKCINRYICQFNWEPWIIFGFNFLRFWRMQDICDFN